MAADHFDALARSRTSSPSRRTIVSLLAAGLGGNLALTLADDGEARKKKCKPCRKKRKGKCKGKKPDGTSCGEGTVCQNGQCVSIRPPEDSGCGVNNDFCTQEPATCQDNPLCECFVTVEGYGMCANTSLGFEGCPPTTECTSSLQCPDVEFCVALPCCPEGKAVCIPLCVPPD